MMIPRVMEKMVGYFGHDTKRINHALKVFAFSQIISSRESPDAGMQEIIAYTALLHDIGILKAEQKYKSSVGKYQQIEGPPIARQILTDLGIPAPIIDRVCFITAHHHTYSKIDGIDFQIIVEADFLVNIFEDDLGREATESIGVRIFKTEAGKNLLRTMYLD
jgi:HD superfamily phosphodiesterase